MLFSFICFHNDPVLLQKYQWSFCLIPSTGTPGTPQNMLISCNTNANQFTLEWSPPIDAGGMISHYLVNVTGPPGFNCPPDQCNVTTTTTTITGLKCTASYMFTVRAVNCIGEGSPTQPMAANMALPCECKYL